MASKKTPPQLTDEEVNRLLENPQPADRKGVDSQELTPDGLKT